MELRGLEPLTPTLPAMSKRRDEARQQPFLAEDVVVRGAVVVTVVVSAVVRAANGAQSGQRRPSTPDAAADRATTARLRPEC